MASRSRKSQPPIVKAFGVRLKQLRTVKGVTQAELARSAVIPASHLSDLENGLVSPGLDLMGRLAAALDVPVTDLLLIQEGAGREVKAHAREVFTGLLDRADADIILALDGMLGLLDELASRRR